MNEQQKRNISIAVIKVWQNPEYRKRVIEGHKGIYPSEKTKQKMSIAHVGHYVSEETKRKLREINIKREEKEKGIKKYRNKEWLYNKYINEKLTTIEIGKLCDCSNALISSWLKKYDIPVRTPTEWRRFPPGIAEFNEVYNHYKQRAKRKNINFKLNKEEFKKLTQGNCNYCGIVPKQIISPKRKGWEPYVYNGIDRIDSNKGYVLENCITCCGQCNRAKNTYTVKEFKIWLKRTYEYLFK